MQRKITQNCHQVALARTSHSLVLHYHKPYVKKHTIKLTYIFSFHFVAISIPNCTSLHVKNALILCSPTALPVCAINNIPLIKLTIYYPVTYNFLFWCLKQLQSYTYSITLEANTSECIAKSPPNMIFTTQLGSTGEKPWIQMDIFI